MVCWFLFVSELMSGFELVSEYWFLMAFETWFGSGLMFSLGLDIEMLYETGFGFWC